METLPCKLTTVSNTGLPAILSLSWKKETDISDGESGRVLIVTSEDDKMPSVKKESMIRITIIPTATCLDLQNPMSSYQRINRKSIHRPVGDVPLKEMNLV